MAAAVKEAEVTKAQSVEDLEKELLGPKKSKADKKDEPKVRKDAGKLGVVFLASLFWLSLFSALLLFVLFDPTEDQVIRGKVLLLLNPNEETREEYYMSDILDFQDWEKDLDERERLMAIWEDELDLWEEDLDERESDLEDREYEVEMMLEDLRGATGVTGGAGQLAGDMTQTIKAIERMTPLQAAQMLEEMDFEKAIFVCASMGAKKLAPILDVMDPDFRAALMDELLTEPDPDDWDWDWD